jgi:hypothetical protein
LVLAQKLLSLDELQCLLVLLLLSFGQETLGISDALKKVSNVLCRS